MKRFNTIVFDDQQLVVDMFETRCTNEKGVYKLNKKKFNKYQEEGYTWTIEELDEDG